MSNQETEEGDESDGKDVVVYVRNALHIQNANLKYNSRHYFRKMVTIFLTRAITSLKHSGMQHKIRKIKIKTKTTYYFVRHYNDRQKF